MEKFFRFRQQICPRLMASPKRWREASKKGGAGEPSLAAGGETR